MTPLDYMPLVGFALAIVVIFLLLSRKNHSH